MDNKNNFKTNPDSKIFIKKILKYHVIENLLMFIAQRDFCLVIFRGILVITVG